MRTSAAPRVPELNAEFAQSMGIHDGDLVKLRDEIRHNIGVEAGRRLKLRNKDNAMNVLFKVVQMDVPNEKRNNHTREDHYVP